jgi:hypothetical protein
MSPRPTALGGVKDGDDDDRRGTLGGVKDEDVALANAGAGVSLRGGRDRAQGHEAAGALGHASARGYQALGTSRAGGKKIRHRVWWEEPKKIGLLPWERWIGY